ncbi:hypothetical protein pVco7_gp122 [Vibrio phage pVco-7]
MLHSPNANDSFTYTTGQLNGKAIKNGDMLFLDAPANTFDIVQMSGSGGGIISVNGKTGTNVTLDSDDVGALGKTAKAADSALLDGVVADTSETPNTIVKRDGSGDIEVHSAKFTAGRNVGTVPSWATIPFRGNTTNDSALRFANMTDFKAWLDYTPTNIGAVGSTGDEAINGVKTFNDGTQFKDNLDLTKGGEQVIRKLSDGQSHGAYFNNQGAGFYDWANAKSMATYNLNGGVLHYFDNGLRTATTVNGLDVQTQAASTDLRVFGTSGGVNLAIGTNGLNLAQTDASGTYQKSWLLANRDGSLDLRYNGATKFVTHAHGAEVKNSGLTQMLVRNTASDDFAEVHTRNANAGFVLRQAADAGYLVSTDANGQNVQTTVRAVRGGATELWYNNVKKFETTGFGTQTTGNHLVDGQQISLVNNQNAIAFLEIKSSNPLINRGFNLAQRADKSGGIESTLGNGTNPKNVFSWQYGGGTFLNYNGSVKLSTEANGIGVVGQGIFSAVGANLILKGKNTGASNTPYLSFQDSNGKEDGFVGYGTNANADFYVKNNFGNVRIDTPFNTYISNPHSDSPQGTANSSLVRRDYVDGLLGSGRTIFEGPGPNITLKGEYSGDKAVPHILLTDAGDNKLGEIGCITAQTNDVSVRAYEGNVLIQPSDAGYTYITKPRMFGGQEDNYAALTRKSYVDDLSAVRTIFAGNVTSGQTATLNKGLSELREIIVTTKATHNPSGKNYVFSKSFDAAVLAVGDRLAIQHWASGNDTITIELDIMGDTAVKLSSAVASNWSAPTLVKIGAYIK